MVDLLNSNLLDESFGQFPKLKFNENIFEKVDESKNYVASGFSYSTGVVQLLSKIYPSI